MSDTKSVKVCAIMTSGRWQHSWCRSQIERSFQKLNISLEVSIGVFYGQCMQMMMEKCVSQGIDYVITVDGDTLFTPDQLQRLLNIIVQEKDTIDALCAIQARRGKKSVLGTKEGVTRTGWDGYPIELDTGHFGLTILSVEKLKNVAKPWFFSQPNEQGGWDGNKIDDDIWFWCQWKKAGNTLYMDPGVRIGHLEEMITVYDENLQIQVVYPHDWIQANANKVVEGLEAVPS